MPSGDYLIHVHVQKAKRLCLEDDDICDPFIRVKVMGKHESTAPKEDVARDVAVTFDDHMFINIPNAKKQDLEDATIVICAENRGFFKGDLIGQFEIAVNKVYNMESNVMKHQWIALNNPDGSDFSKITGYVAVSIQVQGPGDEAVELKLGSKETLNKKKPLVPTQIKKEYKQAYLRFYIAENLPKMDINLLTGKGVGIDAYCKVSYAGKT